MWQALREEIHPKGIEIVTVGLDSAGPDACRPFIEAASPTHPSLIDTNHVVAEKFGVVNIPNGIWIDEGGRIVRPAEPANPRPRRPGGRGYGRLEGFPDRMNDIMEEASKIKVDDRYPEMLRDWAEHGAASRFVLAPEEVIRQSGGRDTDAARGAAHFALGARLWQSGDHDGAVEHWREAHRLQPDNISYKRQAWSLASPGTGGFERFWQGPVPGREEEWPYDSDWLSEIQQRGAERYYPPLEV